VPPCKLTLLIVKLVIPDIMLLPELVPLAVPTVLLVLPIPPVLLV